MTFIVQSYFDTLLRYLLSGAHQLSVTVSAQAAQAHHVWVRASELIWSEYTRIISVLSDAK